VLPVAVGVLAGLVAAGMAELGTNWIVYIIAGLVTGMGLPYASRLLGDKVRALTILLFFCLPLAAGFNLIYKDVSNPAGYNGIRINLVFLIAATYAGVRLLQGGEPWVVHRSFVSRTVVFGLVGLASFINSADHTLSVYGLASLSMLMFTGWVACDMCARRASLPLIERVLIIALLVQCGVLLMQQATGAVVDITAGMLDTHVRGDEGIPRYGGTLGIAPSLVAQFLSITLLFAQTHWYVAHSEGRRSRLVVAAFALGVLCLALTLTRSAWIAFSLGSLVLGAYWARRGVLKLRSVTAVVVVVGLAVAIAWPEVSVRLQQDHKAAAEERENLLYIGLEMVKAHPVLGIGINTSRDRLNEFVPDWFTPEDWVYVPHNQYLIVAEETGVVGLLAFLWLLWTGASAAVRSARADDPLIARMGMTLVSCFVVMIWAMNIDFYGGTQMYVILWVLIGFACGLEELRLRDQPAQLPSAPPMAMRGRSAA